MDDPVPLLNFDSLRMACSKCSLKELCLPLGMDAEEVAVFDRLVTQRRSVRRGELLFSDGDSFQALYAVRGGFFKSVVLLRDGRDHVTGFHMPGEIIGLDGIGGGRHACDMVALEDSMVCVIEYSDLERMTESLPRLRSNLLRLMSREIVRDHGVMMLLGSQLAGERIASFLLNLSQRFEARGFSPWNFVLPMTRAEIGSYLGLKLETVSRVLSRMQGEGLIRVDQKAIRIERMSALLELIEPRTRC